MSRWTPPLATALAVLLCLSAGAPADGQERRVRSNSWFDIVVEEGVELKSRTARAIEKEATAAIEAGLELLGLDAKRVFYLGVPEPAWMGKPDKLRLLIVAEPSRRRVGIDHWVTQLHAGGFTIELPVPDEVISEEFRRRLWRELGAALLGNTLFKGSVPWWTAGVLRVLEESCVEEPSPAVLAAREKLALIPPEELEEQLEAVLAAPLAKDLDAGAGREISYFLVDLLNTACPQLLRRLQRQMQTVAYHLLQFTDDLSLRRDFVALLREQLIEEAGQSVPGLAEALLLRAEEGWQQGRAFRKTTLARQFRKVHLPEPFGVKLEGRWGRPDQEEDGRVSYLFDLGQVIWRLPTLGSKYELWTGLHGKLPRGKKFEPDDISNGLGLRLDRWSGRPSGGLKIPDRKVYYGGASIHYHWMLLDVISRNGSTYRFYRYWKR